MATAAPAAARRVPMLIAAVGLATALRAAAGAPVPAASAPAALLFSAVLLAAVAAGRGGGVAPAWRGAALGLLGGAALVVVSLAGLPSWTIGARAATATLTWWVPLVMLVAVSEELVLRGVLFTALSARHGEVAAVIVTTVLFAGMHVPMYGAGALPVDLCAGLLLGSLRVLSGGVLAPVVAHAVADVATGWLP